MAETVDAASAALAAVRAELARAPPAVAVELEANGGVGGRVRLRLRLEPFHEALAATEQARPCPFLPQISKFTQGLQYLSCHGACGRSHARSHHISPVAVQQAQPWLVVPCPICKGLRGKSCIPGACADAKCWGVLGLARVEGGLNG